MHNIFTYQLIAVLLWDKNTASKVKLETSIFLKQWYRVYSNIHIWRYFQLLTWAEMFVMTLLTCATVPVSLSIYHHPIIITCGHSLASVRQQTLSSHPLTLSCFLLLLPPSQNSSSLFLFLSVSLVILQLTIRTKEMFLYSCSVASRVSRARCEDATTWMLK